MPWWVKFLRACSRQCRNNLHIDSTYLQTYTEDNVQKNIHILSTHSVLLRHTYSYQYTLYTVCTHSTLCTHIYTHSNMRRCNRLYISYVSWMCIRTTRFFVFVQCVRVVQLNCVKVKVQCMAYRKVGVCCRVYYFWLLISLIAWEKKLSLSRLVRDRMLRRRLPEGSRESSLWDGWLESLIILRAFLVHRLV